MKTTANAEELENSWVSFGLEPGPDAPPPGTTSHTLQLRCRLLCIAQAGASRRRRIDGTGSLPDGRVRRPVTPVSTGPSSQSMQCSPALGLNQLKTPYGISPAVAHEPSPVQHNVLEAANTGRRRRLCDVADTGSRAQRHPALGEPDARTRKSHVQDTRDVGLHGSHLTPWQGSQ
jgi:hypothetical protein